MPLKIAHVTSASGLGGVGQIILDTARSHRDNKGAEHVLATFPTKELDKPFLHEVEKAGFIPYRFQNNTPHYVAATLEYVRFLKQHQIQILCAHGHKPRILGWPAARYLRIPIIGVSHGWIGISRAYRFYERIDKWMHQRMDHNVCVSQAQADEVIRYGTPASRVTVIHNSLRMERFHQPSDVSYRHRLETMFPNKPRLIIGAAGRLSPEKGFDILVSAADKLLKAGLNIGVIIFGECMLEGTLNTLQRQIDDCGISQSVVLAGFTDELDKFMWHFDLFVQPSRMESFGLTILEAMAAKTAVAATRVGGIGELVVDASVNEGGTGLMVPPNNPEALAEAMQKVLSNDDLRRTMGENGRRRAEQHFAAESQAEKYWELFERVLRRGRGSHRCNH